ncbi:hypothetical protein niasHS_000198 [Heterodera schachtii]|uniref:Uncharacterized protein n=1 Tax=Heterodera schachtii TaxID=97005 RepID=A0ABD2KCW2_HETSC
MFGMTSASSSMARDLSNVKRELKVEEEQEEGEIEEEDEDEQEEDEDEQEEDEDEDEQRGPPLSDLVHSKKELNEVVVPYGTVLNLCRSQGDAAAVTKCLVGCMTACKMLINGTVIVDQIDWVNRDTIGFKHSSHPTTLLRETEITDQIFREWVDQLVLRGEPLPLFMPLRERKMHLVNRQQFVLSGAETGGQQQNKQERWSQKKKRNAFRHTFGADIAKILVHPWQLVQLLQLGQAKFERVVVGLYVVIRKPWSLERIEGVAWNAVPTYKILGQGPLNVVLCFKEFSCKLFRVDYSRPNSNQEILKNETMVAKFIAPSAEHIKRKAQELAEALRNTKRIKHTEGKKKKKTNKKEPKLEI